MMVVCLESTAECAPQVTQAHCVKCRLSKWFGVYGLVKYTVIHHYALTRATNAHLSAFVSEISREAARKPMTARTNGRSCTVSARFQCTRPDLLMVMQGGFSIQRWGNLY